jgi:hypothetical protein
MHGAGENAYKTLVVKCEGGRLLERLGHRWEDNIKIYSKKVVCENVDLDAPGLG